MSELVSSQRKEPKRVNSRQQHQPQREEEHPRGNLNAKNTPRSLLGADVHTSKALSRRSINFASSSPSPTKPSMSPAKRRLVIVLPPVLLMGLS